MERNLLVKCGVVVNQTNVETGKYLYLSTGANLKVQSKFLIFLSKI